MPTRRDIRHESDPHDRPDLSAQPLLQPVQLGALKLPNRVVMAPMTRSRADNEELAPTP
ncbi:hypothetical protein ACH4NS_33730 [Streptomyces mutabilis]|uniref:hypothetical protein n=1 Tax=Streptomyces mutabilis TaxID=67332 RepID=UPI0037B773D6